ncbi:hypothetical protein L3Y34_017280 [Caenorhabditis briggsae]|uniref:KEN domain-containing protein n=1 Tax=Caenorhabditis briggsae TaxID=6238 RepID=A0AAE9DI51_CAEBR|nr:hypothetical protein L3Y34_017280 [Caenorhabditis briggsae]
MKSLVKNMNIHVESIYIHWAWHPEIKIIRVAKGDSCFLTIIRRRSTRYNNILVSWQLMFNAFFDFETLNGLESCLQFWDHATYIFKPKKIIVEFHNDQLASEQIRKSSGHAILCCPRAVRGQPVRLYPDAGSPGKNRDQSGRSSGWGVTRLGRASPLPNHAQQHEPEQYFAFERSESECEAQDWKEYKKTTWDVRPWDVEVAQKESCHFLAEHLVARLTDPDVAKIPAKFINRHPYFWSDDLKLDYIQAVSEKFKSLKLANVPERVLIEMDSNDVIGRSFKTKLCTVIASVVSKYNGWEVYDVLRRIRNFKAHYYEASTAVSQVFSPEPIKILEHFSKLLTISI